MKRVLRLLGVSVVLLLAVLVGRALAPGSVQPAITAPAPLTLDAEGLTQHLAAAVAVPTIASQDPAHFDPAPFIAFRELLDTSWPGVASGLQRELVAEHSLLYTWKGLDPDLPPVLLLAHQDVVPVSPETLADWTHPPFAGTVADGWVWGRGTLDDKVAVVAILEAVESLWRAGFRPQRSVILAFGHDEEVAGSGAVAMAALLTRRGVRPLFILDEGLAVTHGLLPGLEQPAALVGLAEKGYLTLELTTQSPGGHSSMPPKHTAIGTLARAITRLEASPMAAHADGPMGEMFRWIAPEMGLPNRLVFRNRWLFGPLVQRILLSKPTSAATVRTTMAITMVSGGVKENVLPAEATATVNFRVFPGENAQDVLRHVERAIDDTAVRISVRDGMRSEASPVSRTDTPGWVFLASTIRAVFPDALVAPGMSVGATDARAYTALSDSVYRFSPIRLHKDRDDTARLHGTNERIAVENLEEAARFYAELIQRSAGTPP